MTNHKNQQKNVAVTGHRHVKVDLNPLNSIFKKEAEFTALDQELVASAASDPYRYHVEFLTYVVPFDAKQAYNEHLCQTGEQSKAVCERLETLHRDNNPDLPNCKNFIAFETYGGCRFICNYHVEQCGFDVDGNYTGRITKDDISLGNPVDVGLVDIFFDGKPYYLVFRIKNRNAYDA
jgi:hypothetical protein